MQITVNETNLKIENGKLIINIDSDLEKVLGLNKKPLSDVKPGEVFNDKYIVLEHFSDGSTAVICKDLLENKMTFGESNNWAESSIRRYLNDTYLKELENEFGRDNIINHHVDLLSMDGLDDYGITRDFVSLLTIDEYRKYRKLLGKNFDSWWWLSTPDSTPSGWSASCVRGVDRDGCVSCGDYFYSRGVRPFFVLKSDIFVS